MTEHKSLAEALAAFQAELPRVGKGNTAKVTSDKGNYSYKYADLADVSSAVLPVLAKHGLSFSSKPTLDESGRLVLAYVLRHVSGEEDRGVYPLGTGTPQQIGSAATYARRYALTAITGVAPDGDDDGKAADDQWLASQAEEQMLTADGFENDIHSAKTGDDLTATSKVIRRALSGKTITRAQYDRLVQIGSARRAALEQMAAAKAAEAVVEVDSTEYPPGLTPAEQHAFDKAEEVLLK